MNTLATSVLLACLGVLLAAALRHPARRLAGAGPAFGVWLLPPLLAAVAWLPAPAPTAASVFTLPTLIPVVAAPVAVAPTSASLDLVHVLVLAWLTGAGLMLARLIWHSWRIARHARALPPALREALQPLSHGLDLDLDRARMHPAGPAVCWLPHCRLLLPADLAQRLDRAELAQVLAHERMHLARRDPLWSLLAEITLAALWLFPPAWLAMRGFRLDQELACDAAIVRAAPEQTGAYARALLANAVAARVPALATPWLRASQLKRRLIQLQAPAHTTLRRRGGYVALVLGLAGVAWAAQAALPGHALSVPATVIPASATAPIAAPSPASANTPFVKPDYRQRNPPHYPPEAIKNHEQGTVKLLVKVGADGKAYDVTVKQSSGYQSLDAAASKAARGWLFNPAKRNGKPIAAWSRITVNFTLDEHGTDTISHPYRSGQLPVYPPLARKHHLTGTVDLLIKVGSDGKPVKVQSQTRPDAVPASFIASATKAAWTWRFNADRAGRWLRVPVVFGAAADK